jgi:hypothetical protein
MCVDRFAAKAAQTQNRLKRGGGIEWLPLDDHTIYAAVDPEADEHFRQEWVRSVFTLALNALRREGDEVGKSLQVALFEEYAVADTAPHQPSYRDLAARHDLPETTVTNHLAWARGAFRVHVLDVLRSMAGSEAEYRDDVRELLGVEPG